MARPRNAPTKPPDETPDAESEAAPAPPVAASERDEDEPVGRVSKAGAAPPVKVAPSPAGRKTAGAFVEGRRVAPSTQTDDAIRIKASENPNFILTLDPARWNYYPQADRIMPDFGKIRLVPGIGRVDARGRPDLALADASKAGRTVIYDRDVPGGYLREFDMIGGVGFLNRWERIKVSGRHASIVVDFDAFAAFVDQALADGTIDPPSDVTIGWLRDQAENMIRLSEPRKSSPSVAREIAVYEKQIAACDRMLAEVA
jgi:hypothetical protein